MTQFSVGLSGNVDVLRQLQAQRAFQSRRSGPSNAPEQAQPSAPLSSPAEVSLNQEPAAANRTEPHHPLPMDELKNIAGRTGFVGLTDRAVQRAYTMGESLFVDYRV